MRVLSELLGPERASRPFVALVSPSIRTLFGKKAAALVGFLKSEGARAVFPVDSGIPEFARRCAAEIAEGGKGGIWILSACPAARPFIQREFPGLAGRILTVPSPMALRSIRALGESGLGESGFALAITPCVHKKSEQKTTKPEMIVIQLPALMAEAKRLGVDALSFPESGYDDAEPEAGLACRIAEVVAGELGHLGIEADSARLDGEGAARSFLGRLGPAAQEGRIMVAEVDFCEGGCSVPEGSV